ncbi:aminodeoxychorismate synthase component I [Oceanospirillum linum]|uniref:aminodeoxychorismate synthase n=1 Tax=Oceanospirillum linum TaxID=966 RepID=A0A1T1H950_OCELI|nr:aminodeoxychorismate synthase component I [Oceanospirillum linum]OOV86362.1 aminodeoxychorismate synthase, component I [Oceanospirillum linum]SEG48486.1 aminodeoxychorismate synthase, subunit I [Oleiphilus messinensis]SMP31241.1 aminodeoxychorismate synthase, subunit I [Oceanospirillum linum]
MTRLCTRSLPYRHGIEYFERIRHLDAPVLLDSNKPNSPSGRYDIVSASPAEEIQSFTNSLPHLQQVLNDISVRYNIVTTDKALSHLPFAGGFIGGLSYDLGRELEALPESAKDDSGFPSIIGGIYLWAVVVDHERQTAELVTPETQADELMALLTQTDIQSLRDTFTLTTPFTANLSWPEYKSRFNKIMAYIRSGDCYQINFAQRFQARSQGDSWQAYLKIRAATPAPFSAYLDFGSFKILSVSPERFMQLEMGHIETKPIKGTAPRSGDAREDRHIAENLQNSIKDRAENLMIVDLLRNDLGRVCKPGSVKVPVLFALESYANVHHLVSTIRGELPSDKGAVDLLSASFPGGSITGAPKIRAMEIIDELEPQRRAIYCGSIGYISFNGRMDSSITIRTLLESVDENQETGRAESRLDCWGGGGIVYDSVAESEYQETLHKVGKILQSLQPDFKTQAQFKVDD